MPASPAVYDCNAVNRGVYIADNLDFLRSLNDACIDLVCIDPPFDKNETFVADQLRPPLTEVERQNELRLLAQWGIATPEAAADAGLQWPVDHRVRGGYKDIWRWDTDIHEDWVKSLDAYYPAVHSLIETTRLVHSDGRAAYLCFMAVRLIEIHRVLKPAGSLYLHCDHAANSYLRGLLDAVFGNGENGRPGFRNQITWNRTRGRSDGRHWGNVTDTILFYSKSSEYQWRNIYLPVEQDQDTTGDLTGANISRGESGAPWRGINPSDIGRHWAAPRSGSFAQWVEDNRIPGYTRIESVHDRLDALDEAGLIRWSSTGRPSLLRPAESAVGAKVNNLWADIGRAGRTERTNYPTQKPVALAERIITASTNEGDIVLDCFAGCAYVATAAERTNRRWVACDLNPRAWTVFKRQFNKPNLALLTCNDEPAPGQGVLDGSYAQVFGPHELPVPQQVTRPTELTPLPTPERRFRPPKAKPVMTDQEMLTELLQISDYTAWCCGFANRRTDGTVIRQTWNFHLDHIDPVSAGGINEITNRAPMCPHHNIRKSSRLVALREYRNQILAAGEMQMPPDQLVDLGAAHRQALQVYARYARNHSP